MRNLVLCLVVLAAGCGIGDGPEPPRMDYTVIVATTSNCPSCERDKPLVARLKAQRPEIRFIELCYCDPDQHGSLRAWGIKSYPTYIVLEPDAERSDEHGRRWKRVYYGHSAKEVLERFGVR